MTFLEKLKEDSPNENEVWYRTQVNEFCPHEFGYGKDEHKTCDYSKTFNTELCVKCWNREMPNTEAKVDVSFTDDLINQGYNKGLNDAWELARKLYDNTCEENKKIFDEECSYWSIIRDFTPQEALAKLKAYEESQLKLKVGDVIKTPFGANAVITQINDDEYVFMTSTGSYGRCNGPVAKTGNHLDISSILEQIGE